MRSVILTICAVLLFGSLGRVAAQEKIGETVYLDGDVSVVRDGDALSPQDVVIGLQIENYDLVKTGDDGSAQVRLESTRVPSSTISVSPDTQFTFELSTLEGRQRSSVNLIAGSISLKVSKLAGSEDLDVQTENTVLGVRGTDFTVTTAVSGDVLVTCDTGEVVCTSENGTEYQAVPGTVVESPAAGAPRQIPVAAADLETFRRSWIEQRRQFARRNAAELIRFNVARYQQLRAAYDRDYAVLQRERSVIQKWISEDRGGRVGAAADVQREKRLIGAAMLRLRRTQFLLERVYYRLLRLKTLHDQGFGRGALTGPASAAQFFDQLQRDRPDIERRLATVRYVTRLYLRRNNDEDPSSYSLRFRQQRQFLRERPRR